MIHQYKSNGYNIVLDVNSGSVHYMDRAAVHIQHNVVAIAFILMYHELISFRISQRRSSDLLAAFPGLPKFLLKIELLINLLAALISHSAGGLAGRLTGGLALAASALLHRFLQISCCQCLNVFHHQYSPFLPLP